MIDEKTTYLKLSLPHPDNLLEDDVLRLRETLQCLDADAKTQDDFYQVIQAAQGGRVRVFESPKSYWLAIPLNQINKNPQLVQNPGY